MLKSPKKTIVASYAPGLVDFSHLTALPYVDRCKIQQFLATGPQASGSAPGKPDEPAPASLPHDVEEEARQGKPHEPTPLSRTNVLANSSSLPKMTNKH